MRDLVVVTDIIPSLLLGSILISSLMTAGFPVGNRLVVILTLHILLELGHPTLNIPWDPECIISLLVEEFLIVPGTG